MWAPRQAGCPSFLLRLVQEEPRASLLRFANSFPVQPPPKLLLPRLEDRLLAGLTSPRGVGGPLGTAGCEAQRKQACARPGCSRVTQSRWALGVCPARGLEGVWNELGTGCRGGVGGRDAGPWRSRPGLLEVRGGRGHPVSCATQNRHIGPMILLGVIRKRRG